MNSPYFMNIDASNTSAVPLNDQEGMNGGDSRAAANTPVIPLPNPGEGGPVGPDNGGNGSNIPVIPLPNPGEGGPVGPDNGGNGSNIPVIPLPNPGEGGPVGPDNGGSNIPVIPLPNPGEGGPVANPSFPPFTIITTFPRPDIPCFFCGTGRTGRVRFLNASTGYNPFLVYINNQLVVERLSDGEVSRYGRVASGNQTITVTSMDGYIYIQKSMRIAADSTSTIAIINTASGLDLTQIADVACNTSFTTACFRACNLSYNSGALDVILNNGYVIFSDVRYKEVTPFSRIQSGEYQVNVARTGNGMGRYPEVLVSSYMSIKPNTVYTMYIFNWNTSPDAIRTMVVEDRK